MAKKPKSRAEPVCETTYPSARELAAHAREWIAFDRTGAIRVVAKTADALIEAAKQAAVLDEVTFMYVQPPGFVGRL